MTGQPACCLHCEAAAAEDTEMLDPTRAMDEADYSDLDDPPGVAWERPEEELDAHTGSLHGSIDRVSGERHAPGG